MSGTRSEILIFNDLQETYSQVCPFILDLVHNDFLTMVR